jgi:glycosyltransferase involved in cell wall biosynthesis
MLCLNMIVKNEAKVIARCLESVKPIVDSWVIVDTGSTDGTQDIVRSVMKDLPGELHERPWKDFAHNRNEAIALARGRGDYLFVIDADDLVVLEPGFTMPTLSADGYYVSVEYGDTAYSRLHVFRADLDYRYVGVLHEVLVSDAQRSSGRIDGLVYRCAGGGARSDDPDKFRKDAAVLERAIREDPSNARNVFYLAQSWRDCGELAKALEAYERRVAMGGWEEEVFCSLHEIGRLTVRLEKGDAAVTAAFLRAYERRPSRAEPLCSLASYLRERERRAAAYPFARVAAETPKPDDILFLDASVYAWRALDEWAVAAYWTDRHEEAIRANERLLAGNALPEGERARVKKNMQFSLERLGRAAGPD